MPNLADTLRILMALDAPCLLLPPTYDEEDSESVYDERGDHFQPQDIYAACIISSERLRISS